MKQTRAAMATNGLVFVARRLRGPHARWRPLAEILLIRGGSWCALSALYGHSFAPQLSTAAGGKQGSASDARFLTARKGAGQVFRIRLAEQAPSAPCPELMLVVQGEERLSGGLRFCSPYECSLSAARRGASSPLLATAA